MRKFSDVKNSIVFCHLWICQFDSRLFHHHMQFAITEKKLIVELCEFQCDISLMYMMSMWKLIFCWWTALWARLLRYAVVEFLPTVVEMNNTIIIWNSCFWKLKHISLRQATEMWKKKFVTCLICGRVNLTVNCAVTIWIYRVFCLGGAACCFVDF